MEFKSRKYDRFIACENVFAALGRNYSKIGKIKDLSLGGLAFEYITAEDENLTISDVDVFLSNSIFHLYNLPCRVIYDIEIHSPYVKNKFRQMAACGEPSPRRPHAPVPGNPAGACACCSSW